MNWIKRHLSMFLPSAQKYAQKQLHVAELELLDAQVAKEAWDCEVGKLTKRVARLRRAVQPK